MLRGVVLGGLAPHPPVIVPEVGKGDESQAIATVRGMETLAKEFAGASCETLVIITPHGPVFSDAFSLRADKDLQGDLREFGARRVSISTSNDLELAQAILDRAKREGIRTIWLDKANRTRYRINPELDHGTVVPLSFLSKAGFDGRLVVVNIGFLPYGDAYRFGKCIREGALRLGRRVGVLASGDLSHRLTVDAPSGFHPRGKDFDSMLVEALRSFDVEALLSVDPELVDDAGQCGLSPVVTLLGALDGTSVKSKVLSYEGPFGVGYCTALLYPGRDEPYPVRLARETVEHYVDTGQITPPTEVPPEFERSGGAFVSIYKEGQLRGCIGTLESAQRNLAWEIALNAISSATDDPRFDPISAPELELLEYSVDVLSELEPVDHVSDLDPRKYGVVCQKGRRRGLLLPDLPGIESVEDQIDIARKKAGIRSWETDVRLFRFTVERYR